METNHDYFFALQLQRDLMDGIDDRDSNHTNLTKSNSDDVIDLTNEINVNKKRKLFDINEESQVSYQVNQNQCLNQGMAILGPFLDGLDPNPDIHSLFLKFNQQFFWGTLDSVLVQWSKKMTACAGLCRFDSGFCSISLSEPLLKFRPRKDLVQTLLHEMIHAYLFLTKGGCQGDRDGHGPEFCKHMYRINMLAGTEISIYHNFHDEVKFYQKHWWKCNGPCQYNGPFYGYVKRSMNRAPGPNDKWWANHKAVCNGIFIKVKEPEKYGLKKKSAIPKVPKKRLDKSVSKITNFFEVLDSPTKKVTEDKNKVISKPVETKLIQLDEVDETTPCPICNDPIFTDWLNYHLQNCNQLKEMFADDNLDDKCKCPACNESVDRKLMNEHLDSCKMISNVFENDSPIIPDETKYINCPTCDKIVKESYINAHLDVCLLVESSEPNIVENQIKCPCCENMFKSVEELDNHIDACLL